MAVAAIKSLQLERLKLLRVDLIRGQVITLNLMNLIMKIRPIAETCVDRGTAGVMVIFFIGTKPHMRSSLHIVDTLSFRLREAQQLRIHMRQEIRVKVGLSIVLQLMLKSILDVLMQRHRVLMGNVVFAVRLDDAMSIA